MTIETLEKEIAELDAKRQAIREQMRVKRNEVDKILAAKKAQDRLKGLTATELDALRAAVNVTPGPANLSAR